MWTSLRTLGSLTFALVLGSGVAYGGDLSNVTVGRFEDFTVVTLFGEGPLSVTHQIVEAKDGKPHRIVVDVTGALHRLPQNNYAELPEGSITAIRTSQFAVSPEPVVRVVLDLAHPAAYRLESPEGQVRLLVSLPGDPAMASTWSAREGALPATGQTEQVVLAEAAPASEAATSAEPAQEQAFASADPAATADPAASTAAAEQAASTDASAAPATAEPSATEGTSENTIDAATGTQTEQTLSPSEAEPAAPASTEPAAQPASTGGEVKALPLAPAGALAVDEATSTNDPSDATTQNAWDESASSESAMATADPAATEANQAGTEHSTQTSAPETAAIAAFPDESNAPAAAVPQHADAVADPFENSQEPWKSDEQAPEVPLPEASKAQPERVIDYNLPMPAALAATAAADAETPSAEAESEIEAAPESTAPKMAVKSAPEGEAASSASTDLPAATGTDEVATDVGSAPVASLSTLPPMVESAEALVPERQQIIYHTHGKRDPFKALLTAGGYSAAALPDVTTLRLVGVLQDVMESWGLFEDANGYGYILRKGDRVKNGSLTQLTNNRAYFNLTEFGWSRSVHIDLEPEG